MANVLTDSQLNDLYRAGIVRNHTFALRMIFQAGQVVGGTPFSEGEEFLTVPDAGPEAPVPVVAEVAPRQGPVAHHQHTDHGPVAHHQHTDRTRKGK